MVICLLFYLENKSGGQLGATKNNTLSIIREFWKYLKTQIVAMVGGGGNGLTFLPPCYETEVQNWIFNNYNNLKLLNVSTPKHKSI